MPFTYAQLYTASQDVTTKQRVKIGMRKEAVLRMADVLQVETTVSTDPVVIAQIAANNALHKSRHEKMNNFANNCLHDNGNIENNITQAVAALDVLPAGFTDVQLQAAISTVFPLMAGVRNYEV